MKTPTDTTRTVETEEKSVSKTSLAQVWDSIKQDTYTIRGNDPALKHSCELVLYLGLWAVIVYRLSNYIYNEYNLHFTAKILSLFIRIITGIEIHPAAQIGPGLFIDHGCGVVIGETAVIGSNCILFHGCTLGGTGKEWGKRHPTIGDNVVIGAGAKILGNITLGDNVKVGAGSVVVKSSPSDGTIIGIPGRFIPNKRDIYVETDIHHDNMPDVDGSAIRALYRRNIKLANDLSNLKSHMPEISAETSPQQTLSEISDEQCLALLTADRDVMEYADGI
jgi:serine O-acetyltransferase